MIAGPHATPLRLIHSHHDHDRTWSWSGGNPADAAPPRVLTHIATARLAALNGAVRDLRAMGLKIKSQTLGNAILAGGPPLVRISRDPAVSIAPLLDAAGPRVFVQVGNPPVTIAHCLLRGVMVAWEERP